MFVYRPQHDGMIQPLALEEGLSVVDFGCGPGFVAMEFARRVGSSGRVFGLDINRRFIERATERVKEAGLTNIDFIHLAEEAIPLADASVDRLFCKNVLEYVPDALATLAEHFRVLAAGGRIQLVDSDWGFVVVEPWGKQATGEFFDAASGAFKEPYIGRKLYALLGKAGFEDIEVRVSAGADVVGGGMSVLTNMVSYIRRFETLPAAKLEDLMATLEVAVGSKQYMFVLPQFIVTGTKPA
jgi:ubiquinone/menaquinone biosynthesis C-methylase UbiE